MRCGKSGDSNHSVQAVFVIEGREKGKGKKDGLAIPHDFPGKGQSTLVRMVDLLLGAVLAGWLIQSRPQAVLLGVGGRV